MKAKIKMKFFSNATRHVLNNKVGVDRTEIPIEIEVNKWLQKVGDIEIISVCQSIRSDVGTVNISIWYK